MLLFSHLFQNCYGQLYIQGDLKKFLLATRVGDTHNQSLESLTFNQKVTMCGQVALGMEHLSSLGIVHRDLASRNVLLTASLDVKISCTALSGDGAYAKEYYPLRSSLSPSPLRWMAPETVNNNEWTAETDIWAYGVFAWEVCCVAHSWVA